MKLIDLLKDKLMGVYIDVIRDGKVIKSIYNGMEGKAFLIETDEDLREGEEVVLRLSFGGWNFVFPCKVGNGTSGIYVLIPSGKVKITEKRKEKRIPSMIKCSISGSVGTMLDMSYHGTRVLMLNAPDMGSEVTLSVEGNELKGTLRWMKNEESDLKSAGILIDDPPEWWKDFVKRNISSYLKALGRL